MISSLGFGDIVPANAERCAEGNGSSADMETVAATLRKHHRFLITSHARPDGDAIGSCLACAEMLVVLGKSCDIVLADFIPAVYQTLPGVEQIRLARVIDPALYDIAVVLECDSTLRTGLSGWDALPILNIDHHVTGCNFGTLNWIDESAAAVAVLVYRLARTLGVSVTPSMANCLYTAVLTDTGAFTFPGTASDALPVAQELIAYGADADRVARDVLYSVSVAHIRLLGTALSRMELHGATAWSYITQEDLSSFSATDEDSEGTVDYLISIAGVDTAMFLRELPDQAEQAQRFRVSLRSKTMLDVSAIAAANGGGGHYRAAGCTLPGPLEHAVHCLLDGLAHSRSLLR